MAYLVDLCVIATAATAIGYITSFIQIINRDAGTALYVLAYFLLTIGYGIGCEYWWRGQTLGKWLLGLRVMDASGLELQFSQIAMRNVLRIADMLPFFGLLGGIFIVCHQKRQRIGDVAAGTVVVKDRHAVPLDVRALTKGRYNSFLAYQGLCAQLRQQTPVETAALALDALLRRDRLAEAARVELFEELAAYFHSLVEFPEEHVESLSAEQLVRNVVEILYSRTSLPERPPALTT